MFDSCSVRFKNVRLFKRSISERSILFDLQNFGVSSIKFDYQTQSKSTDPTNDWSSIN